MIAFRAELMEDVTVRAWQAGGIFCPDTARSDVN